MKMEKRYWIECDPFTPDIEQYEIDFGYDIDEILPIARGFSRRDDVHVVHVHNQYGAVVTVFVDGQRFNAVDAVCPVCCGEKVSVIPDVPCPRCKGSGAVALVEADL